MKHKSSCGQCAATYDGPSECPCGRCVEGLK